MKIGEALAQARRTLRDSAIEDASLEGEVLLRHALGIDRARLFSSLEEEISQHQAADLGRALERRRAGEPAAYITGHREFFGLDFIIDRDVLIPRPETEMLVEKAIELARKHKYSTIADIGTGSGVIAVSLAVNLPGVTVYATDVSPQAVKIAGKNARLNGVDGRIVFLQGDLLEPLPGSIDLIIANLPYVRASDLTPPCALSQEPALALDGGNDGLDIIRTLCSRAPAKLEGEGCLLMEVGQGQAQQVVAMLRKELPEADIKVFRDLAGIPRVVALYLT